jgi:hypothetical protein
MSRTDSDVIAARVEPVSKVTLVPTGGIVTTLEAEEAQLRKRAAAEGRAAAARAAAAAPAAGDARLWVRPQAADPTRGVSEYRRRRIVEERAADLRIELSVDRAVRPLHR